MCKVKSLKYSLSVCRKTNNIQQLYLWTSPAAVVFTHREKKLHYCTSLAAFVFKKKTRKWLSILSFWFYVTSNFWAIFCKIRATSGNFFEILEQLVAKARLSETLYIRNQDRQTAFLYYQLLLKLGTAKKRPASERTGRKVGSNENSVIYIRL